ncbi:MAG: hypothetical protein ACI4AE_03320 [Candidatus Cryptobacteroides sp.]
MTRICVLAPQTEYTLSGCYGHSCGELAPRALPAGAVALSVTEGERLSRLQPALVKFIWTTGFC